MAWFIVKRGHLAYRGRITKPPFTEWCPTREGSDAIARVAKGIRFSLVGRARTARGRVWRAIDTAARSEAFAAAVRTETQHFEKAMADACYADALPRVNVALGRLVLVPRALVNTRARAGIVARLTSAPMLAGVDEAVTAFLLDRLVIEMDAAMTNAAPRPRRPVEAMEGWCCIGVRLGTIWADPLWAGPHGTGHLFMYELRNRKLTRREYKAIDEGIDQLSATVSTLSRTARDGMLRAATLRRI